MWDVTNNHLGHIQQVDLEEEAEHAGCDLVGSPTDGVAQFVAHSQTALLLQPLEEERYG